MAPDNKKLTCLWLEACQVPAVVSMNLPNRTWTKLWSISSLSMSREAIQAGSEALAGTESMPVIFPATSCSLCQMASPFCPSKHLAF